MTAPAEAAGAPSPPTRRFARTETSLFLDPDADPIAELEDGERFTVETADSLCGVAKANAPSGMHIDEAVSTVGGACPLTGPFYVRGARPGDALAVEIHTISPDPAVGEGWTGIFGGFGALDHERYSLAAGPEPEVRLVPYADGVARLWAGGREVEIEMEPFFGTVGVAPARERRLTFSQSPEFLGDVDIPALGAGATVLLPVNVEGALVGFGDVHGAQGDGEVTGAALEIEAVAELTVSVVPSERAGYQSLPQINTDQRIGSVAGFHGVPLADCARAATVDLIRRLEAGWGLSAADAYLLLSQVGELQVGNMIDPFYSVMASIERRHLP